MTVRRLGIGLIHNDAHPGNLLPDPAELHGYVMTDWDGASIGPRELDVILVGAPGSRLRDIRDLHSLAGHIRAAPHKPAALAELRTRVRSPRDDDLTVRW